MAEIRGMIHGMIHRGMIHRGMIIRGMIHPWQNSSPDMNPWNQTHYVQRQKSERRGDVSQGSPTPSKANSIRFQGLRIILSGSMLWPLGSLSGRIKPMAPRAALPPQLSARAISLRQWAGYSDLPKLKRKQEEWALPVGHVVGVAALMISESSSESFFPFLEW